MRKKIIADRRDAESIHVRLTPVDKRRILAAATDAGMKPGPWLRWIGLRVATGRADVVVRAA